MIDVSVFLLSAQVRISLVVKEPVSLCVTINARKNKQFPRQLVLLCFPAVSLVSAPVSDNFCRVPRFATDNFCIEWQFLSLRCAIVDCCLWELNSFFVHFADLQIHFYLFTIWKNLWLPDFVPSPPPLASLTIIVYISTHSIIHPPDLLYPLVKFIETK